MRKVIRKVSIRCWSGRRVCRMRLEVKVSRRGPRQSSSEQTGGPQRFQWLMSFSDGQKRPRPQGETTRNLSPSWADDTASEVGSNSSGSCRTCIDCDLLLVDDDGQTASAGAADLDETDEFLDGSFLTPTSTSSRSAVADNQNQNQNQNQAAAGQTAMTDSDSDSGDIAVASDRSSASFFCSHTGATIVNAANAGDSSTGGAELESPASGQPAGAAAAKVADTISHNEALEDAADGGDAGGDGAADADAEQDSGVASSDSAPTKQAELRRFYEAELDLAVRLNRTIVDPEFQAIDMRLVGRNLRLVKQRRHPTQLLMEGLRQEEMGVNRLQQLLMERRIKQWKLAVENGTKKQQVDSSPVSAAAAPAYPEWLTFQLRIKKEQGDLRWLEFVRHRGQLRSAEPRNSERTANVRENQKYSQQYIDVWTNYVTLQVKSGAIFSDAVRAAFHKLGLEHRADFRFTIGCFLGDTRGESAGTGPKTPVEIFEATPVLDLYHQNASDIFVNSNKLQLYRLFPELFDCRSAALDADQGGDRSTKKRKRKGRCC